LVTAYPSAGVSTWANSSPFRVARKDVPSGWHIRKVPFLGEEPLTTRAIRIISMDRDLLFI
jgi:hypothetical protein